MELLLTGRMVGAEEAARMGLVNKVVQADQLENATKELALTIVKTSPVVARMIKVSTYEGAVSDLPAALENETRGAVIVMTAGIWQETIKASTQNGG